MGQLFLDKPGGFNEGLGIVIVFRYTGGNGKNVGVQHDILRRKTDLFCKNAVSPLADLNLALDRFRLTGLIECHHHHASAVTLHTLGLLNKRVLTFLEADRVDDPLALHALQAGLEDRPF